MNVPLKKYTISCNVSVRQDFQVEAHNIPEAKQLAIKLGQDAPSGNWHKDNWIQAYAHRIETILPHKKEERKNFKVEVISL